MTTEPPARSRYSGARVHLAHGRAHLRPRFAERLPDGWARGEFSVLSPGTERRHLAGPGRDAGYMNAGRAPGDGGGPEVWVLGPVPHGTVFDPAAPGVLTAPGTVPVTALGVARFQHIARLGLDRLPPAADLDLSVVIGSGPVALGCVLELHRRGADRITVVTGRRYPPIGRAPYVTLTEPEAARPAGLVIDTTGDVHRAVALTAPGGVLGLLGTPGPDAVLPARDVHRSGVTVVGMHELVPVPPGAYEAAFTGCAEWISAMVDPGLLAAWCRIVPGEKAPEVYALLNAPGRPADPVILFDWRTR
ncbi:hypothetical protein ABT354_19730 [Streptomyces sp. NPDC000594]|uniref:hypothetical protein n=1 Tax=Streptomyces sp. NPDC000594 TaxID=3154261 RepID=UPI003333F6DF